MQATYQTRMLCDDAALSAYAAMYGRVQRRLFAEVSSGRSAASMKRDCVREYGIPARMFNAVRVSLEGKVSGARGGEFFVLGSRTRPAAASCAWPGLPAMAP